MYRICFKGESNFIVSVQMKGVLAECMKGLKQYCLI